MMSSSLTSGIQSVCLKPSFKEPASSTENSIETAALGTSQPDTHQKLLSAR